MKRYPTKLETAVMEHAVAAQVLHIRLVHLLSELNRLEMDLKIFAQTLEDFSRSRLVKDEERIVSHEQNKRA